MNNNENNENTLQNPINENTQELVMSPVPEVTSIEEPTVGAVEVAPVEEISDTTTSEPTPVVEEPIATPEVTVEPVPVIEPTPVVEETTAPSEVTVEPPVTPIIESSPVIEPAPEIDATSTVEPVPTIEPVPVIEPTPVVEEPTATSKVPVSPETPTTESNPVIEPTPEVDATPTVEPVPTTETTQPTSGTSTKKSSPIAIVILVVAVIILIVFGINKLGIFSKDKDQGGAEGGNDTGKTGTLLENITINSYTCMNEECTYNINGMDENSIFYFKGNNKELFDELNDYKDDIKVNIYYKEEKGKKNITSYEIYTKESNENISSVKDLNELREKLGLYALGTQTDELTLKEIGTPGLGSSGDKSYAYVDYKFENNSGKIFKMKYIFNDGESQNDINLEIDKKYNVTFEVVEGFIHIEYNIKSINQ